MDSRNLLDPITPGEILKEDFLGPLKISINQLARNIGVPPNRISEIVNGKRMITADTALRLQRFFGVDAQFWLNLQLEYDLRLAKRQRWTDIEKQITPIQPSLKTFEEKSKSIQKM
jgi:addiction module HigA family antidote